MPANMHLAPRKKHIKNGAITSGVKKVTQQRPTHGMELPINLEQHLNTPDRKIHDDDSGHAINSDYSGSPDNGPKNY